MVEKNVQKGSGTRSKTNLQIDKAEIFLFA